MCLFVIERKLVERNNWFCAPHSSGFLNLVVWLLPLPLVQYKEDIQTSSPAYPPLLETRKIHLAFLFHFSKINMDSQLLWSLLYADSYRSRPSQEEKNLLCKFME